jgi:hypothetical protein
MVRRRQVRGEVAPVSRRKRAPRKYPLEPELAEILRGSRGARWGPYLNGHVAMRVVRMRPSADRIS